MMLIKSISGIRGIIGGKPKDGLTPIDVIRFISAYSAWIRRNKKKKSYKVVVGRDARISGEMIYKLVSGTLLGTGIDIIDLGLTTSPTIELAVTGEKADGGIIISASHNPREWNALKLPNQWGEFLTEEDGQFILDIAEEENFLYSSVDQLGKERKVNHYNDLHIRKVLELDRVDTTAIRNANFKIVIDCVNSVGSIIIPELLRELGVKRVVKLYCEPSGRFPHNPEPVRENLAEIAKRVVKEKADLGFVVDSDVDRLAIVNEDGSLFGEEYTLVAVADYILSHKPGNAVSNLSSTRALKNITEKYGGTYFASPVGESNVVQAMKQYKAVIGGEGSGGVIYPELHYGRDALVGIALFLTHLAKKGKSCKELRSEYPDYFISKNKVNLTPNTDIENILKKIKSDYSGHPINNTDGVKIEFPDGWVHLRKSKTEPIIRIYAEEKTEQAAADLANQMIGRIRKDFL